MAVVPDSSSALNVFLPVQLCTSSGLLLGKHGRTEKDVVCGALLPSRWDAAEDIFSRARKFCDLLGLLVVRNEAVDPEEVSALPLDFVVQLDVDSHVVASFTCSRPRKEILVIFYDALSAVVEGEVPCLLGTEWLRKFSIAETDEDFTVVTAVKSYDAFEVGTGFWQAVLVIATLLHKTKYLLQRKVPKWALDASDHLVRTTATGSLVLSRLRGLATIKEDLNRDGRISLPGRNLVFGLLADALFGLALSLAPSWCGSVPWDSLGWARVVVANLRCLLRWLMGAPAGLKLNAQLSSALGRFFLYHISLWETYVSVVWPWVSPLLHLRFVGLGLRLGLASDLLSLATLHVYCFYGYAGRLYWTWVRALGALGRQGRACKWNPLRQRTDSYRCNSSERLFLCTLLFAVLLFLFPTVALYYAVFLTLRLAVLAVQSALHRTLELWDAFQWYVFASRSLGSGPVVGDVHFEVIREGLKSALYMKVDPTPLTLGPLPTPPPCWRSLVRDMLLGNLLYPV